MCRRRGLNTFDYSSYAKYESKIWQNMLSFLDQHQDFMQMTGFYNLKVESHSNKIL